MTSSRSSLVSDPPGRTAAARPGVPLRAAGRAPGAAARPLASSARAALELGKPRIVALVVCTAAVGYRLGEGAGGSATTLLALLVGTALAGGSAGALNQILERASDARMRRTARRPLPSGRIAPTTARGLAALLAAAGVALLAALVNLPTALLAAATIGIYAFAYTPLKRRSPAATWVGSVAGALPIAGGWTAATGRLDAGAASLFGVLFLWQLPHSLALGWLYRGEQAAAGFRLLPTTDATGRRTGRWIVAHLALLLPAAALPWGLGLAGPIYAGGSSLLGLGFLGLGLSFARAPTPGGARRLFAGSVLYLPCWLLLAALGAG